MQFKHIIWNLTKKDIDLVNVIINIVEMYDRFNVGHTFDYNSPIYMMELTYHELASSLGYLTLDQSVIDEINSTLDRISKTPATLYYTNKGDRVMENTTFLLKYTMTSSNKDEKRDLDKRFSMMLSTSIVKILRENKELFVKLYTHDRYEMRGKYSTVLYDYIISKTKGSNVVAVDFTLEELVDLIDFDLEETGNTESWAKINSNVLKRASKEIIDKTGMYFNYATTKQKVKDDSRKQTTNIKFEISVAPVSEATPEYFTEEILMERKIAYYMERELNRKMIELKKFHDTKIKNEEAYRFSERQRLTKLKADFHSMVKIQEMVNWIKYNNPGEHGLACFYDYEGHNYVTVNTDYRLVDVETKQLLSKNPVDTLAKIEAFVRNDGEYGLADVDADNNNKDYSISYSKG